MQTNLSFSLIFNQTKNFIRNRFWQFIIVSLITGLFHVLVSNYIMDEKTLEQLANTQDVLIVLSTILKMLVVLIFASLIIVSVDVATIYNLAISDKFNIKILLSKFLSSIIKVFGIGTIYTFIILFILLFFGLVFFTLRMVMPELGTIMMIFFMVGFTLLIMTVYYFFIGSIIAPSTKSFIQLFVQSHQLAKKYWQQGCLILIIDAFCMLILSALSATYGDNFILDLILSTVSNLVDIFVICFFYRINQLLSDKEMNLTESNPNNTNLIL
ncbi:hypothetical protein [Gilliamella sp. wkB112]|uniref:hypothetical protein n=1 Tax=Gilliamella sp. wkB112 TaxID=3120257 RepID=UPI00080EA257|nr:hypothetical protein [Gilliamella apicola]OCG03950.1 hypothetical protein A9G12_07200 [Gilliamella apicola]